MSKPCLFGSEQVELIFCQSGVAFSKAESNLPIVGRLSFKSLLLGFAGSTFFIGSGAAADLSSLISDSPFGAVLLPKSAAADQSPQVELRGIVHEGSTVYLTFYEATAKKWTTLCPGESAENIVVENFAETKGTVALRVDGKPIILTFSTEHERTSSHEEGTALASAPRSFPQAVVVPGPSPAETRRLELVASAIRQQLEQAKLQSGSSRS